jgi:PTH1 family peptidyl-tRNA hydrolase
MKLVVGLGNPGSEYRDTRHNMGFMVVEAIAAGLRKRFEKSEAKALTLTTQLADQEVVLVKPQTYMNLSGQAVVRLLEKYHLAPGDLIVIYDDIDLPFGTVRIRERGGSGGHKGIQSIIDVLGTKEFTRIRLGIREHEQIGDTKDYVLSEVDASKRSERDELIARAARALEALLKEGTAKAMSLYNQRNPL